ncbi:hypothetical protein OWR29_18850 [Actinoplanes sp. Pm04-4]|uniref:Uncharacterized protein n=1 Tax=Paractinoplanes pyxinae TaxID=2997416 RepID=A0ABT4B0T6_9ACTN|nr:hypothetical protein [Actinoplanes pyxinae]MCY1140069.1 hypothetical protein [Actinoplanes pyxinae]
MNDATSSLGVSVRTDAGAYRVRFYNWTNCSSANGYVDREVSGSGYNNRTDFGLDFYGLDDWIGSVQIFAI